jgi:hypothetical protein
MPNIPFVQYLRPHGERRVTMIDRPQNICSVADKIITSGLRFEVEVLMTGMISLTITSDFADEAIEVVSNGPGVAEAVDKLITEFDLAEYLKRAAQRDAAA